jgi:hypothetical protein
MRKPFWFCQPATKRKDLKRKELKRLHRQIFLFRDFEIFVNLTQHLGPTYEGNLEEKEIVGILGQPQVSSNSESFFNIKIKSSSIFNYN